MTRHINTRYYRSINIQRDANNIELISSYIPTCNAISVLERIASTKNAENTPRSWNIIGPYGSGKSSFAMFLNSLLDSTCIESQTAAVKNLTRHSQVAFTAKSQNPNFLTVSLVGTPTSLKKALVEALTQEVPAFYSAHQLKMPEKLSNQLNSSTFISNSDVISLIQEIQNNLCNLSDSGILIAIDELGKFLEYEVRTQGASDIYLLQELAELATIGCAANLYVVSFSHQSFDKYAVSLDKVQKDEWTKIQGRYENIPYLEPHEEIIKIMGQAIRFESPCDELRESIQTSIEALEKINALPAKSTSETISENILQCYPLHPVTVLLLPILCQSVAQNERTLFSYLASNEPFGFSHSIEARPADDKQILPWTLYNYFIENQPTSLLDSTTHHRWAQITSALDRMIDNSQFEIELVKTIGLLNLIGAHKGLKASFDLLKLLAPEAELTAALTKLSKASIIVLRTYNSEYRVWEGSDFNLNDRLLETRKGIKDTEVVGYLCKNHALQPVVANRHSIRKGNFRYHNTTFCTLEDLKQLSSKKIQNTICYVLESKALPADLLSAFDDSVLIAQVTNQFELKDHVASLIALEKISKEHVELKSDPVALREYKDFFTTIQERLDICVKAIPDYPDRIT